MFKTITFSKQEDCVYRYIHFDTLYFQSTRAKSYVTPTYRAQSDWEIVHLNSLVLNYGMTLKFGSIFLLHVCTPML